MCSVQTPLLIQKLQGLLGVAALTEREHQTWHWHLGEKAGAHSQASAPAFPGSVRGGRSLPRDALSPQGSGALSGARPSALLFPSLSLDTAGRGLGGTVQPECPSGAFREGSCEATVTVPVRARPS